MFFKDLLPRLSYIERNGPIRLRDDPVIQSLSKKEEKELYDRLIDIFGAGDYSLDINANGFSLSTNGASEAEVIFTGKSCTISSNGASEIELTTECESLSCESRGSSRTNIKGTADITKIKSHGASKINTSMLNQF